MDRTTELTDAYVEVKFADLEVVKTHICRKTLNPTWNQDFRFEIIEDSDLQNEPLELKIMDYDTITYNDPIGTVFLDLNPLLTWDSTNQIAGWFPIYDTLQGVRGELHAQVKIQFFGDINPFKDSSAGVQFFSTPELPPGYHIVSVLGFVSALDNEDDPEYHWADSFRTPRKSNESRTRVFYRLSGRIRRLLGRKVLDLSGNAILGFKQYFDREADKKSITVRSIGTACKISKDDGFGIPKQLYSVPSNIQQTPIYEEALKLASPAALGPDSSENLAKTNDTVDELSLPSPIMPIQKDPVFLTINKFPENSIVGTGGFVCAASIKILDNDEREIREAWWSEIRDEIKSHARSLSCTYVIGYVEKTSISDEIVLLFCSGTAVNIEPNFFLPSGIKMDTPAPLPASSSQIVLSKSLSESQEFKEVVTENLVVETAVSAAAPVEEKKSYPACRTCHITYNRRESPFPMALTKCLGCKKKYVPEVLLYTCEPSPELEIVGDWILIEAHVCRTKKLKVGETRATSVSESIPFAQYDIHRQLMYKLRIYGLNAIFGLKIQITVGNDLITAVATGTATFLKCLPMPPPIKVFRNMDRADEESVKFANAQQRLLTIGDVNRKNIEEILNTENEKINIEAPSPDDGFNDSDSCSSVESNLEGVPTSRLTQKQVVIEIDDEHDEDMTHFFEKSHIQNFKICNLEYPPCNFSKSDQNTSRMVTMVRQHQIGKSNHPNRELAAVFIELYEELAFQMSFLSPCIITGLSYKLEIPRDSTVQVCLTAMAIGNTLAPEFEADPTLVLDQVEEIVSPSLFARVRNDLTGGISDLKISDTSLQADLEVSVNSSYEEEQDDPIDQVTNENDLDAQSASAITRMESFPRFSSALETFYTHFTSIELSTSFQIPNSTFQRFLGRISLHFIKESNLTYEGTSGMGGFTHIFIMELTAIIKHYVICLGGNAVVGFNIDQVYFAEDLKNQGYALISISGDVVEIKYEQ